MSIPLVDGSRSSFWLSCLSWHVRPHQLHCNSGPSLLMLFDLRFLQTYFTAYRVRDILFLFGLTRSLLEKSRIPNQSLAIVWCIPLSLTLWTFLATVTIGLCKEKKQKFKIHLAIRHYRSMHFLVSSVYCKIIKSSAWCAALAGSRHWSVLEKKWMSLPRTLFRVVQVEKKNWINSFVRGFDPRLRFCLTRLMCDKRIQIQRCLNRWLLFAVLFFVGRLNVRRKTQEWKTKSFFPSMFVYKTYPNHRAYCSYMPRCMGWV